MYVILHEKKERKHSFFHDFFFSHPTELISNKLETKHLRFVGLLVKSPPLPPNDNYEDMLFAARIYCSYE